MKKILMLAVLAMLCVSLLVACGECDHKWEKATCEEPKTCEKCGETKGEAKGHEWAEPVCGEPKTCVKCEETEGDPLEHDWADATCEEPKTCKLCGETEGDALGHDWADATYEAPKTCNVCGETEGEPLEKPSGKTMGMTCEQYIEVMSAAVETQGYTLKYITDDDDGGPLYGVYKGDEYLEVFVGFYLDTDGKTATGVMVATEKISDSDAVYTAGFVGGVSWGISNSELTADIVSDMLNGTPVEGDDGSMTYYMENNGFGYYIIITEEMIIFLVQPL